MYVKLAEDYTLLISSHKVGKIVHALEGGRTIDPELRASNPLAPHPCLSLAPYCASVCVVLCLLDFIITAALLKENDKER